MKATLLFAGVFVLCFGAACSDSHGGADAGLDSGPPPGLCDGEAPDCYDTWGGQCCYPEPATCADGEWVCGSSQVMASECMWILDICEGADVGPPPPSYDFCEVPSDCTLVANTCCGVCGAPTLGDVEAVNTENTMEYYLDVACPEAAAGEPPLCPDCPSARNPNLFATCTVGLCRVEDISTDIITACTDDVDCVVRARDCCECGADLSVFNLIALNVDQRASFERAVCDIGTGCDDCAPIYPDDISAVCSAGRCELVAMMSTP